LFCLLSHICGPRLTSYKTALFGLTPGAILSGLAAYLALLQVFAKSRLTFIPEFRRLLAVSMGLLVWAALVYGFYGAYPAAFRRILQIILGISVSCSVYMFVRSSKRVTIFIFVLLAAGTISALVGIGQFYVGGPFIDLWATLVSPPQERLSLARVLVPGLAPTSILLGYQLTTLLPLAVALLFSKSMFGSRILKGLVVLVSITMVFALVLSGSRSAIGGAFFGVAFVVLLLRRRGSRWAPRVVMALTFGIFLYILVGVFYQPARFLLLGEDLSVAVRPSLALTALQYAFLHPFGSGVYRPTEEEYVVLHFDPRVAAMLVRLLLHNQFLNILVYYGFPGLVMLIVFYWILFRTLRKSWRATVRNQHAYNYKWMVGGLSGAFLAYLINSMFHNAGPFVGDCFHWFFIGLAFSIHHLVLSSSPFSCDLSLLSPHYNRNWKAGVL